MPGLGLLYSAGDPTERVLAEMFAIEAKHGGYPCVKALKSDEI